MPRTLLSLPPRDSLMNRSETEREGRQGWGGGEGPGHLDVVSHFNRFRITWAHLEEAERNSITPARCPLSAPHKSLSSPDKQQTWRARKMACLSTSVALRTNPRWKTPHSTSCNASNSMLQENLFYLPTGWIYLRPADNVTTPVSSTMG